jgi:type 1 glutamine amidotransferase
MVKRAVILPILLCAAAAAAPRMKVLVVDGQNNHAWKETTPVLKQLLEQTGLFEVDVATTPPAGGDMRAFQPDFAAYKVVVSNYNGDPWSAETQAAFEKYMREGGGLVCYHAADNAFPEWAAYNEMIAVGGWSGRTEASGKLIRFRDGKVVLETTPGHTGSHGRRLPFLVTIRDPGHPIAKGLPREFMHAADELYDTLRGPARDFTLIATAHSEPANSGTGENEPMLLAVGWGKGRIFHTALGHDVEAMRSVAFIATFQRGTEWAATGKVTQKVPKDFPTAQTPSLRP